MPSDATSVIGHSGLPRLNREDINAVRSFLPAKILGRGAAFISLVLVFIGAISTLDRKIRLLFQGGLPISASIYYATIFGVPILIVSIQLVSEWLAGRKRAELRKLAVSVAGEDTGFFRIGPYTDAEQDRVHFSRTDHVHERVFNWLRDSTLLPLYLTGDSGSGKSSLLASYVIPNLREAGWIVFDKMRIWQDPDAALKLALQSYLSSLHLRTSIPDSTIELLKITTGRLKPNTRLLLVLDQFEEFVILGDAEQQRSFYDLVTQLTKYPIKGLTLLLVMRSDYQALVDDMNLPRLRSGENFIQVPRFTMAAASNFIQRSGLKLVPEAIKPLLDSAAVLDDTPGLVRPITLNVIGYVLANGHAVAPTLDAGQLVTAYLAQTIDGPALRAVAPVVLEQMISDQGTKRPRKEAEIMEATKLRRGEVRAVLNGLDVAAIARPLDASAAVWELSHDFVARAILRYLSRRKAGVFRRASAYAAPALLAVFLIGVGGWVYFRPNALRTGQITVMDGFKKKEESGFSFRFGRLVGWNDLFGDILVANQNQNSEPASFFLPGGKDSNNPGDVAEAGMIEMAGRSLSQVKECPTDGYTIIGYYHPRVGAVYCTKVRDGDGYAKISVRAITAGSITFEWAYNSSGRPTF